MCLCVELHMPQVPFFFQFFSMHLFKITVHVELLNMPEYFKYNYYSALILQL